MGLGPSKETIRKILKESMNGNSNEQNISKIECKYKKEKNISVIIDSAENSTNRERSDSSFDFSIDDNQTISSKLQDVENIKKYPYIAIGTITVRFPKLEKDLEYTCFLIDTNVVVTLASNIKDKNKGGRATIIKTTFSDEKVKSENVHIQGEDNKEDEKNAEKIEMMDKGPSKLAVILYEENIGSEWIGVKWLKPEDFTFFNEKEIYFNVVFTLGLIHNGAKKKEHKLREVNVYDNSNLFKNLIKEEKENSEKVSGSPIYYKDSNDGVYAVAIVNERYEFQYFDENAMKFLADMVNQGKLLRKKTNKDIDEDNIVKLDLSKRDFQGLDIQYLMEFDLKNLRILNLESNCIRAQGAFYLREGKCYCLESLNLSFNEIGDEGLKYIANGYFSKLKELYLYHNNITFLGIKYLVKAEFVNKLISLDLSENKYIGVLGIKYMTEYKEWNKLISLNLNYTGLNDIAIRYLGTAPMHKLKILKILGNKITNKSKGTIIGLKMNNINVYYKIQAEKGKEKEKRKKEGKNK